MPDSAILSNYAGTYEGWLAFSLQGSDFICKDLKYGDKSSLRYISGSLFKIDNDTQVEFEKGQNGAITAIRLFWANGVQQVVERDR